MKKTGDRAALNMGIVDVLVIDEETASVLIKINCEKRCVSIESTHSARTARENKW